MEEMRRRREEDFSAGRGAFAQEAERRSRRFAERDENENEDRFDRGRDRMSRRFERRSEPSARSSSANVKKQPREHVTLDLPEKYRDRDKNGDRQIGLYEWERAAFAQFKTLDLNRDGFLTPRELMRAEKIASAIAAETPTTANTATPFPTAANTSSPPPPASADRSSTESKDATQQQQAGTTNNARDRFARYVFGALDKNKDGRLTAEEWEQSERTREMFEREKIQLQFPVSIEQFVKVYPQGMRDEG